MKNNTQSCDTLNQLLEEQKNMLSIGCNYLNSQLIKESISELIEHSNDLMQKVNNSYSALKYEENKQYIEKNIPEIMENIKSNHYKIEKNIKSERNLETMDVRQTLRISKASIDSLLNVVRIKRTLMNQGVTDIDDIDESIKIYGYYASACFAKEFCRDEKIYNYFRNICIKSYKGLQEEESKKAVIEYTGKEFLKITKTRI